MMQRIAARRPESALGVCADDGLIPRGSGSSTASDECSADANIDELSRAAYISSVGDVRNFSAAVANVLNTLPYDERQLLAVTAIAQVSGFQGVFDNLCASRSAAIELIPSTGRVDMVCDVQVQLRDQLERLARGEGVDVMEAPKVQQVLLDDSEQPHFEYDLMAL